MWVLVLLRSDGLPVGGKEVGGNTVISDVGTSYVVGHVTRVSNWAYCRVV